MTPIARISAKFFVVSPNEIESKNNEEHRHRRIDRAGERLLDRMTNGYAEFLPCAQLKILTRAVEHNDRVMHGEAENGQDRGDEQHINLHIDVIVAKCNVNTRRDQYVVHERNDSDNSVCP